MKVIEVQNFGTGKRTL